MRIKLSAEQQALVAQWAGLPRRIARTLAASSSESIVQRYGVDELEGVGAIGLCVAAAKYRPECGAKFQTFAWRCVTNKMLSALQRFRNAPTTYRVSDLTHADLGAPGEREPLANNLLDNEALVTVDPEPAHDDSTLAIRASVRRLPREHRRYLILHYYCGWSTPRISRQLGESRQKVLDSVHRAVTCLYLELRKEERHALAC